MTKRKINRLDSARKNGLSGLASGIITSVLLFVLTKFIVQNYGDDYNGLIGTTSQIVAYLMVLDAGVGIIGAKHIYKPYKDEDYKGVAATFNTLNKTFARIGVFYVLFLGVATVIFPLIINTGLNSAVVMFTIMIFGGKSVTNYFLTNKYSALIKAMQKEYIVSNVIIIVNVIVQAVMICWAINSGNWFTLLLMWAAIPLLVGVALMLYTKKMYAHIIQECSSAGSYKINDEVKNVMSHKIAGLAVNNTDSITISSLASLSVASIYVSYMFLLQGVRMIFGPLLNGALYSFGDKYFTEEDRKNKTYDTFNFITAGVAVVGFIGVAFFSSTFVGNVYKNDYSDIPTGFLFAIVIFLFFINRAPQIIIDATASFKQTKKYALTEALLNVTLSIIFIILAKDTPFAQIRAVLWATIIASTVRYILNQSYVLKNIMGTTKHSIWHLISAIIAVSVPVLGALIIKMHSDNFENLSLIWTAMLTSAAIVASCTIYATLNWSSVRRVLSMFKKPR